MAWGRADSRRESASGKFRRRSNRPHQNVARIVAAKTKLATVDPQQARRAALQQLHAATVLQAQFVHAANPGRIASDVGNIGPFARPKHIDW